MQRSLLFITTLSLLLFGVFGSVSEATANGLSQDSLEATLRTNSAGNQTTSNCSFIPGCRYLLEAKEGPFFASVTEIEVAPGKIEHRLSITYYELGDHISMMCYGGSVHDLTLVFVVGPEASRESVKVPMEVSCSDLEGNNSVQPNVASWSMTYKSNPVMWHTLFPQQSDGSRWYAIEVAVTNSRGDWDSRFGQNYHLVLKPRAQE